MSFLLLAYVLLLTFESSNLRLELHDLSLVIAVSLLHVGGRLMASLGLVAAIRTLRGGLLGLSLVHSIVLEKNFNLSIVFVLVLVDLSGDYRSMLCTIVRAIITRVLSLAVLHVLIVLLVV